MKNRIVLNSIYLLSILLFAAACSSTKSITIEIPERAQKELPNSIQSLVLVNRTVDSNYTNLDADSIQNSLYRQYFTVDTIIYDSTAVDTCLKATADLLFESGRYDVVVPEERFLQFERNAFFSKEMPWDEAKALCTTFNTDAVLSIDMFSTRLITKYEKDTYYDGQRDVYFSAAEANMVVVYDVLFRVYDPISEKIVLREFLKDTLVWNDVAENATELFEKFTPAKNALLEAGIAAALDFSGKISTDWRREKRPIYVKGDKKLELAGTLIDNGQWEQAIALWKELAEKSSSKSIKSKAQLNMAISYEIQGDIEQAIEWGLKSYETQFSQLAYNYLELLDRRKKELEKLTP